DAVVTDWGKKGCRCRPNPGGLESWLEIIRMRPGQRGADPWDMYVRHGREEAAEAFAAAWDKVRFPPGQDPLQAAAAQAKYIRIDLPEELLEKRCYSDRYAHFLALAVHLQILVGARPIVLPRARLAEVLGVDVRSVGRYRQWACEDRFLR